MLPATHITAGGVVGYYTGNPALAFLAAIVIHFILDTIPHFDTTDGGKWTWRQYFIVLFDFLVALFIMLYVLKIDLSIKSPFLWGAVGGFLPDFISGVPFWRAALKKNEWGGKFVKFHDGLQPPQPGVFFGILVQILLIIIFCSLYFMGF